MPSTPLSNLNFIYCLNNILKTFYALIISILSYHVRISSQFCTFLNIYRDLTITGDGLLQSPDSYCSFFCPSMYVFLFCKTVNVWLNKVVAVVVVIEVQGVWRKRRNRYLSGPSYVFYLVCLFDFRRGTTTRVTMPYRLTWTSWTMPFYEPPWLKAKEIQLRMVRICVISC